MFSCDMGSGRVQAAAMENGDRTADTGRLGQATIGGAQGALVVLCVGRVGGVAGGKVAAKFPDPGDDQPGGRDDCVHFRGRCGGIRGASCREPPFLRLIVRPRHLHSR
jgi:hypothetical protein